MVIGQTEWIVILVIVILVFGIGKLPQVGRSFGQAIRGFRNNVDSEEESRAEVHVADLEPQEVQSRAATAPEQETEPIVSSSVPLPTSPATSIQETLDQVAALEKKQRVAVMLHTLMETFGVTAYGLAQAGGVERSTITRWLKGKTEPQQETLEKVLDAFPNLPPVSRQEILSSLGYPTPPVAPQVAHPPQVYLSCHGLDLSVEREKLTTALSHPLLEFKVSVGEATFPPAEVEASVIHSDYLVLVQGWQWVAIRAVEYQGVREEQERVAGLYFQRQERSPQPEVIQFQQAVGRDCWHSYSEPSGLPSQVLTELRETMIREARAGRTVSLQSLAALFLLPQLLGSQEASLSTVLDRLTAQAEPPVRIQAGDDTEEPAPSEQRVTKRYAEEPELILIPAGQFWMGSDRLDLELAGLEWQDWMSNETPNHRLSLPDYAIGRYPVTNAEYAQFIKDGGYQHKPFWTAAGWEQKEKDGWIQPGYWTEEKWNQPTYPVINVSWYEAVAYCRWLAQISGRPYRLPTEAEWEKAARGPNGRLWPWGNHWDPDRCNSREKGSDHHGMPVGQYSPDGDSYYGVADMVCNVFEWCATQFRKKPYPYDIKKDEWARDYLEGTNNRALRGGFWNLAQYDARCAYRFWYNPYLQWFNSGVRVVVSPFEVPNFGLSGAATCSI